MNIHPIFALLLLGHVLGDFYLQSDGMAKEKKTGLKWLVAHGMIYAACMASVLFIGVAYSRDLLWIFLAASILHLTVDLFKCKWFIEHKKIFSLDQLVHLAFLSLIWFIWGNGLVARGFVEYQLTHLPKSLLLIVLGLLYIWQPVGLLIKNGDIWDLSKTEEKSDGTQKGAGQMIGYLERTIVFFLLLYAQYSAISFVIAAKSVIRFPEISQSSQKRALAEYYLIGTLLSMTSVFVVAVLLGLIKS